MVYQPTLARIHFKNKMRLDIHLNWSLGNNMNWQDTH